ncbi:MAG: PHP domain-containing protein [Clostridia bacterium]|nr:PHP domain-containing protein [Clostridia bacterium]
MSRYFYDLHIHSCLSPCGDDDMTPENIAGMGALKGLQIMALTDHNSSKNCPAFFKACKRNGIIPIAGMELTTAEDVHMLCLFPTLESAMDFDSFVYPLIMPVKNNPQIFGNQIIYNENDEVASTLDTLLISATSLDISNAIIEVEKRLGVCYPAHIDRPSNGIITALGDIPEFYRFKCCEFNDPSNIAAYRMQYPITETMNIVCSSDAHCLWNISEAENSFEIDDEPYSGSLVRQNLIFNLLNN